MIDFTELVKQCAVNAVNAEKPAALVLGVVTRQEDIPREIPLEITLEQKIVIKRDFLFDTANTYSLKEGERLLLLRQQGGQRYLLLDTLREEESNAT